MLKSQNKNRRLRKPFILILTVILTFSVLTLEGFKKPYRADNEATPTTYGSYSTNQYYNGNVGPTGTSTYKPVTVFAYSFNGTYNGRFTIYWKYWRSGTAQTNTLQAIELMLPVNCYVEAISDSSCTIAFKNQSEIAIILQSVAINDEIEITGVSNYNMTKITDGVASQLDHLNNMIDQLFVNSGTIITRFNTLNQTTTDILNAIQDYFTDNNGTTVNIGDIILQFNEFNAQLQLQLGILNDLKTALNNIDTKIDTISWNNITFKGITTDFSTFNASYTQQTLNNSTYVAFNQTNEFAAGHANVRLFKLTVPAYASNNDFKVYFNSNPNNKYEVNILFAQKTRGTLNIYFTLEGSSVWGNLYPTLLWNGATIYTSPTPTLQYIDNNDIEYWELYYDLYSISYMNNTQLYQTNIQNKLDDVIEAINGINISISDDTVQNTETIIQEYNENYTTYHNVENNYINNYQTIDTNLDKTNFDNPINVNGAKGVTDSIINKLFGVSYFKVIFYVILLGFIVIKLVR